MDNYAIVNSACLLTAVAYSIVFFRIVVRRLQHEKLEPDDYVSLIALIFYTITTVSYPVIVSCLADLCAATARLTMAQLNNGTNIAVADPKKLSPAEIEQG